jgi:ribosomal protein S18 acetylase RimI-like enzyme
MRRYRSATDLALVGALVRRAYAERPLWNGWTFARWDIWSHRRLAAARLDGTTAWQDDFALWEDGGGELVAAAFIGESPRDGVVICDTSHAALAPELLAWVEERHTANGSAELRVEVGAANPDLAAALAARGYERTSGYSIPREKRLDSLRPEPARLPPGFRFATLENADLARYQVAVQAVFGYFASTVEEDEIVRQCPSFAHDLGVTVLDENDAVVSFAETWLDRDNNVAEFEPVGTIPSHQKLGLASAVMREVENRLRPLGCPLATVYSWSEMEGANRLYDAMGYRGVGRQEHWQAPG